MRNITNAERKFLMTKVLPNYMVYYNKEKKAYCSACTNEVNINLIPKKQGQRCKCPHCGTKDVVRYYKANKKFWYEQGVGIIPDKNEDDELVLRYFYVCKNYESSSYADYYVWFREITRETFRGEYNFDTEDRRWGEDNWRTCKLPYGDYRESWYTHRPLGTHVHIPSTNVCIYTRNINKYTNVNGLEHINFRKLFGDGSLENRYVAWNTTCSAYGRWGLFFEYLQKSGLQGIASQIAQSHRTNCSVDLEQKSLVDMLQITKEEYKELLRKGSKATLDDVEHYQIENKFNLKSDEDWNIYNLYIKSEFRKEDFIKHYKFSWHKWGKYEEQYKKLYGYNIDLAWYVDYASMCDELGLDMRNTFVAFPKDLNKAHDMVADMYSEWKFDLKLNKYAEEANQYSNKYADIVSFAEKKYAYENDKMKIVVPANTNEIGYEGFKLRHCVAQYTESVVNGERTILFIRNKDDLSTPFFTLSIIGGEINECKGYRNCPRPADVQMFLEGFAKKMHLTIAKNEHFAAVM